MQIEIDEGVCNTAGECEKDFVCISKENHKFCEVEHISGETVFVIKCKDNTLCNFRIHFGYDSYLCTCPVRKEIYRKYKR
jgi:hypothetical protein